MLEERGRKKLPNFERPGTNILRLHLNPHGPIRGQEAPQNTTIKLGWFYTASFYAYFKVTSFWMCEHVCPSTRESTILIGWSPPWNDGHQ
jgi:hypothetical protein